MKYYGVFRPQDIKGVYSSWDACKGVTSGVPSASYCAFKSASEAFEAITKFDSCMEYKKHVKSGQVALWKGKIETPCIVVDASCRGSPGPVEYRGVVLPESFTAFELGPFESGTNNIGEFLAIVHGIQWMNQLSLKYPIYSDSNVAISWIKAGECRTTLESIGKELKNLIKEAEVWLRFNFSKHEEQIKKWNTLAWGEIPADYGRK